MTTISGTKSYSTAPYYTIRVLIIYTVCTLLAFVIHISPAYSQDNPSPSDFRSPMAAGEYRLFSGPKCGTHCYEKNEKTICYNAIDVILDVNTPLYASTSGTVYIDQKTNKLGLLEGYGSYVRIDRGDNVSTLYGHLSTFTDNADDKPGVEWVVENGQHVEQGQLIGFSGNSGESSPGHLHFEVRIGGVTSPLVAQLPWLQWYDADQYCQSDSGDPGKAFGEAVEHPACSDIEFDGVKMFEDRYCQGYDRTSIMRETKTTLLSISSIYVGTGWSVRVSEGHGQWSCLNHNMWNLAKDKYPDESVIEDRISVFEIFHDSTCNGEIPPYVPTPSVRTDLNESGGGTVGGMHVFESEPDTMIVNDKISEPDTLPIGPGAKLYQRANYEGDIVWQGGMGFSNRPSRPILLAANP